MNRNFRAFLCTKQVGQKRVTFISFYLQYSTDLNRSRTNYFFIAELFEIDGLARSMLPLLLFESSFYSKGRLNRDSQL